jgi:tetratricopeptide (TPR) repeat protein
MKIKRFWFFLILVASLMAAGPLSVSGMEDFYQKGLFFNRNGRYDKAIAAFSKAIEAGPGHANAYNKRGAVWYMKGAYDKAIADYTQAILLNPEVPGFYNNRGAAWFRKEKLERAIVEYSRAVALNPLSVNALKNRGIAWFEKGFYDRAISDYNLALEIDSKSVDIFVSRGIAHYQKTEYDKALVDFVDAVTYGSENADALNQLAWMLAVCPDDQYRNGGKAVETAKKAYDLYPSLNVLDTLASAQAENGQFSDAVTLQKKIISLAQESARQIPTEYLARLMDRLKTYEADTAWRTADVNHLEPDNIFPVDKPIQVATGNIRSEPSVNSFVIEKAGTGTKITLLGKDGQWYLAELASGQLGWAFESLFGKADMVISAAHPVLRNDHVQNDIPTPLIDNSVKMVTVTANVGRIRVFPRPDAAVTYRVVKGNRLEIREENTDWYRLSLGKDKTGWGHKSLFKTYP